MPVTVLNSPIVNRYPQPAFNKATDILAVIGFGIGIIMETVSDIQKYRFKQTHKERGAVCNKGFFAWSRHPNYFAEILIQFCKFARYAT
jgi:steroid 5-alpha reductase family enzyme